MCADLRVAAKPRPRSIPEASQETRSHREKPSQAAVPPGQRGGTSPAQSVLPPHTFGGCSLGLPSRRAPSDTQARFLVLSAPGQNLPTDYSPAKEACFPMLPGWGQLALKKDCDSFSGLALIVLKLLGPKGPWKYQPRQTYIVNFKSRKKKKITIVTSWRTVFGAPLSSACSRTLSETMSERWSQIYFLVHCGDFLQTTAYTESLFHFRVLSVKANTGPPTQLSYSSYTLLRNYCFDWNRKGCCAGDRPGAGLRRPTSLWRSRLRLPARAIHKVPYSPKKWNVKW